MKKTFNFGKIDFENSGKKRNLVTVTIEYEEENEKKVFSASADVWNNLHSDVVCSGQCLDEIAPYIKDTTFAEILRLWELYHLNNMHPECEHQAAAGWREQAKKQVYIYHWYLNKEAREKRKAAENKALDQLKNGATFTPTQEDVFYCNLPVFCTTHTPDAPEHYDIDKDVFTKKQKIDVKYLGHTYPTEHPDGLLCKPCPVCGYKYGTEWKYFPIPEEDEKIIYKLLNEKERDKK